LNKDGDYALMLSIDTHRKYWRSNQILFPKAFVADGPHVSAMLEACMESARKTKLIHSNNDSSDGAIRP
jgi:hypothetical protein